MNIDLVTDPVAVAGASLLVIGAFADGTLTAGRPALPEATAVRLSALVLAGELRREVGALLPLYGFSEAVHRKIVLVALGAEKPVSEATYRVAMRAAAHALANTLSRDAAVTLSEVEVRGHTLEWRIEVATRLLTEGTYRFTPPPRPGHPPRPSARDGVEEITLTLPGGAGLPIAPGCRAAVYRGLAVAEGMALARDLANMPREMRGAATIAGLARTIGTRFSLDVEVLERADVARLGMEALLTAGGADAPCELIVMGYRGGAPATRPIVLLGDGLLGDGLLGDGLLGDGTIHESPAPSAMEGARASTGARGGGGRAVPGLDASGAGAVLGTVWAAARIALPVNLIVVIPVTDIPLAGTGAGRPGAAFLPGRAERSRPPPSSRPGPAGLSGRDGESSEAARLSILCEALAYAEHFAPAAVIGVAPLGGGASEAFGHHATGLFTNDGDLAAALLASAAEAADRAWHLPLWDDDPPGLREARGSRGETVSEDGDVRAGPAMAAGVLMRAARSYHWAHLDITGTAVQGSGPGAVATGRPVPLLTAFLTRHATAARAATRRDPSFAPARTPR